MVNLFDFMVSWTCNYLEKEMCMFVIFCSAYKTERLFSFVLFQITFVCKATHHVTSLALWWQTVKNSLFSTFKVALRILKVPNAFVQYAPYRNCLGFFKKLQYRVIHVSLTFLIWLKMALEYIVNMKIRHFYNQKDPPFDMKHQLMSVDPVPVLKIDLR